MKMCRDLKIQSHINKNKAKYEIGHFCTQYGLPSVKPSKKKPKHKGKESFEKPFRKKPTKYYRKQRYKTDDFYKKGKLKEPIPQTSSKCYNCGKKGHFKSECRAKAKSLINTLISDQPSKNEIFKLLELDRSNSESFSSASDSELRQIYRSSSESSSASTSSGPDEPTPCKDGCCRNKTINVLNSQEQLLLDLIEAIEDPIIKAQKLTLFHQALVKETSKPPIKIQQK